MWPFKADSGKRLRAAASVLAWRLDEVSASVQVACRGGLLDVSRALSGVARTLEELAATDLDSVDLGRSDRLFERIARANRIIDRIEARIEASCQGASDSVIGTDALFLRAS